MATYAKIDVRMWGDERFRELSPPSPCAQFLWIYLLTGPHRRTMPGIYSVGEAALAEALGWPLEGFREAFQEVTAKGMAKADWKARVVWLPKALRYNRPESPNVITSWRRAWDEIPECDLKREALQHAKTDIGDMSEAFRKAFAKAFPEASPEDHRKPCGTPPRINNNSNNNNNTLYEGLVEGEKKPTESALKPKNAKAKSQSPGFGRFWAAYPNTPAGLRVDEAGCEKLWRADGLEARTADILRALEAAKASLKWTKEGGQYRQKPRNWLREKSYEAFLVQPGAPVSQAQKAFIVGEVD